MKTRLLLVDDEEGIRNVLSLVLNDCGYAVTVAANAEEAWERFLALPFELVLTDIKMPGHSGLELLARVKQHSPEAEVIMLTGHGDMDLAIESLKLDAFDFLLKPVNQDVLEIALQRAVERISMRKDLRAYAQNLEDMVREKSAQLVEAERQLAAMQVMEGIASGIRSLTFAVTEEQEGLGTDVPVPEGIFNELPCFVAVHNADLKIVAINALYRERLGNLVGGNSWAAYAPNAVPKRMCPVREVLETGIGHRSDQLIVDKTGTEIPVIVHTAPIYDNDGEVELVLELSVDISEVRRLREDLRQTQERYRRLFDASPCYIAVMDKGMRVVEANRKFRDDFGETGNKSCHELYAHRQSVCSGCPAQHTFQDGGTHQHETVVTAQNGRQVNVLVSTAPLYDAKGNVAEVLELSTDITELRNLQSRLAQLGLLLGSTAHGIKGLLTGMDGAVYRMGSGLEKNNPARVEDAFADMRQLSARLKKLVLDILYYSKERSMVWETLAVADFTAENATIGRSKAEERGVHFVFAPARQEEWGTFTVDSSAMSSALVNILENAVEACTATQSPPATPPTVTFAVETTPETICFCIRDTGHGMDTETREKLFTLFFSSKGAAGTGIGLFVANQVVAQHGGHIAVESAPGQGSAFTITLPRTPQQPQE
ncbi:hybrid sensor histidine kinase/response regulator [Desulfovibrio cuneatus]|uniref:hybrid sensor histidine kinase/response regulator n=1 Tax=Desulfovibrio cuneatus TaxID=159728 RepID=UPI00041FB9D7|nr:response regulator [Desulfovibrio cuneatus]